MTTDKRHDNKRAARARILAARAAMITLWGVRFGLQSRDGFTTMTAAQSWAWDNVDGFHSYYSYEG